MFNKEVVTKFQNIQTPFYYYDLGILKKTIETLKKESDKYGFIVHYAVKANTNDKVLSTIKSYGLGADCVSGGEVKKILEIGFPVDHIVFAGVGKNDAEINLGLDKNIFCFNCCYATF